MRKLASLLALVLVALAALALDVRALKNARPVHALTSQKIGTFSASVSAETTVLTGATGAKLHIYSVSIAAATTSSVWTLRDGTGGPIVWDIYLVGDAPQKVTKVFGQTGLVLTGNKLTASPGSAATFTFSARYSNQ